MFSWDARNTRSAAARGHHAAPKWSLVLVALGIAAALPLSARAVEPAEDFIRELQSRGLHELALDYLELMKTSQAVDEEFRKQIPYHRGVVLIEQSRQSTDPATRTRLLEAARSELARFAQSNSDNVQGAEANLELASMQMAQGQQLLAEIGKLPAEPAYDEARRTKGGEARAMFTEARRLFQQAHAVYSSELERLPPVSSDAGEGVGTRRQQYRGRVAQLQYLAAQTHFESARSFPPGADEFAELNESAAEELAKVYEENSSSHIGLHARLAEGRCYQALGRYPEALGCYQQVLDGNNVLPPFRKLVATAVHRKAELLTAQEKYDEAIALCQACLKDAKKEEEKQQEWLGVRFQLAEALQKKGEAIDAGSLDRRKLLAEARDAYRLVANAPSGFQPAARTAVVALTKNGADSMGAGGGVGGGEQPKTFQAAYDLGKDALASYNAAKLAYPSAEQNNPDALPELQAQMTQGKEDARRHFRAATTLVDDDTDPKLLNEVRYFLCWLYWESEDYHRAAVLGEFIARRYPDHPAAASAAKLAMASYERLYNLANTEAGSSSGDFEAARMADMAEFITRRWPGGEDAAAAQSVLVSIAIRGNRIEDAERLLAEASEQSRPRLEMQLGNAMWMRYGELSRANGKSPPDADTMAKLKDSAVKYLRSGIEAARGESQPSDSVAAAGLFLAQALLSDEKYDEAISVLEDEKVGPLTLVKQAHPVASRPAFAAEAYKAALSAYVLSSSPDEEKTQAVMQSLEDAVKAGGGSAEQLTQIYIGLGVALSKQAAQLREAGRDADARRINAAFAQFLDRIAAGQEHATWPVRAWLAQTYYNMGVSERAGPSMAPRKPGEAEHAYLMKARDAYQQLIADAAKNPALPSSETSVLAARMQLGECSRELGEYKAALDAFSAVLKERESSLSAQKAAAQTYQERGDAEDPRWYENAIHGGYRLKSTGQNRIWGWHKLSTIAARMARTDEKYREMFFEARYNVARCRYLAATKSTGEDRKQDLAKAKQSIQSVAQVYPDLGGEHWRGKFDALLKEIQKAAGQKQVGLAE